MYSVPLLASDHDFVKCRYVVDIIINGLKHTGSTLNLILSYLSIQIVSVWFGEGWRCLQ